MIRQAILRRGACYSCSHLPRGISLTRIYNRRSHALSVDNLASFGTYSLILPPEPYVDGVAHIPRKSVPQYIARPPYVTGSLEEINIKASDPFAGDPYAGDGRIVLGGDDEIKLRRATNLAKVVLDRTKDWVKVNYHWFLIAFCGDPLFQVGMTTEQIDDNIYDLIVSSGAYPSPLGYAGFPKTCCTSVNNVIAHGIPDK